MTLNNAQAAIVEGLSQSLSRMTDDELAGMIRIFNRERELRLEQKRHTLVVGKTYNFTSRDGRPVSAVLVKIAPKNCKLVQNVIVVPGTPARTVNWTVHPSFLKA